MASIIGSQLAINPAYATVPLAILATGNILTTFPLSLIMQSCGRRFGFGLGAIAMITGGLVCCYGIYARDFWFFCAGNMFLGIGQASAFYYRLAATDHVPSSKRGQAVAWVMSGGIVAAIFAPTLAVWSKDFFPSHLFTGSYGLVVCLGILTLLLCLFLPALPVSITTTQRRRPTRVIVRQPVFIAAVSNTGIGHGIMVLIMVSTPLAMLACNYTVSNASHVIQWHVLGMFIPAFFSGRLIDRFGATTIGLWGTAILAISVIISLNGTGLPNFYSSLILLGIGWNFMYTAGSTLTSQSHQAGEKGFVQGMAELIVSCLAALTAFGSGALLHTFGWSQVNLGSIPLLLLAALVTLWFKRNQHRGTSGQLGNHRS